MQLLSKGCDVLWSLRSCTSGQHDQHMRTYKAQHCTNAVAVMKLLLLSASCTEKGSCLLQWLVCSVHIGGHCIPNGPIDIPPPAHIICTTAHCTHHATPPSYPTVCGAFDPAAEAARHDQRALLAGKLPTLPILHAAHDNHMACVHAHVAWDPSPQHTSIAKAVK